MRSEPVFHKPTHELALAAREYPFRRTFRVAEALSPSAAWRAPGSS